MKYIEKLKSLNEKQKHLYNAVFMFWLVVMYLMFMVGDLIFNSSTSMSPFFVVAFFFIGTFYLYKYFVTD